MNDLRQRRTLAGLTQHQLARHANVDRSKISLAETGQAKLTDDEQRRVLRVLSHSLERRAAIIGRVLSVGVPTENLAQREVSTSRAH